MHRPSKVLCLQLYNLIPKVSQRALADKMQLQGIELDKNAIQRIESGQPFITDIELKALANVLGVTCDDLLNTEIKT